MLRIYPTTESGLSYNDYFVKLSTDIFPVRVRPQKAATTLDGGSVVTRWAKNYEGAVQSVTVRLSEQEFGKVMSIVDHASVFEWIVNSLNRRYKCSIDIPSAPEIINISGGPGYSVQISFTVIERLTT